MRVKVCRSDVEDSRMNVYAFRNNAIRDPEISLNSYVYSNQENVSLLSQESGSRTKRNLKTKRRKTHKENPINFYRSIRKSICGAFLQGPYDLRCNSVIPCSLIPSICSAVPYPLFLSIPYNSTKAGFFRHKSAI